VTGFVDGQRVNPESLRFLTDAPAFGGSHPITVEFAVVPFEC
jgi:hypothetical protein